MQFEHLVEVNAGSGAPGVHLSRAQVWAGLVLRAEQPSLFQMGVESTTILSRTAHHIEREIWLGKLRVHDHIWLEPESSIRFETTPSDLHQGGTLTISIEAPTPEDLWLRFKYQTPMVDDTGSPEAVAPYLKSAYQAADVDTVRFIRAWIERGMHDVLM